MIKGFNTKINLSNIALYDIFGLENGNDNLKPYFNSVETVRFDDSLFVTNCDDLINYILSCHGNQSEYLLKEYEKFKNYMDKKVKNGIHITKDAGLFICRK